MKFRPGRQAPVLMSAKAQSVYILLSLGRRCHSAAVARLLRSLKEQTAQPERRVA